MVRDLVSQIGRCHQLLCCKGVATEFDFVSGRTDLLAIDDEDSLHAFEAKLTKWRHALEQARRNQSYAHYIYVVLPARSAKSALNAKAEFCRRGIGLIVLGDGSVPRLEIAPKRNEPLLQWITDTAIALLSNK